MKEMGGPYKKINELNNSSSMGSIHICLVPNLCQITYLLRLIDNLKGRVDKRKG